MIPKQVLSKNSLLLAMLLNIAKAYEMLQFDENKAYAHNKVISVLQRHAQTHSGKFLFWIYHLNFMKNLRQSKLFVCFFEKWNEHLSTDTAT